MYAARVRAGDGVGSRWRGLTRPNGCLLAIALACLVVEVRWRSVFSRADLPKAAVAVAAPVHRHAGLQCLRS